MAVSAQRLKLQGIVKDYPGCRANDGVDLTVGAGEIHALLGENGAGKSTLMKIIYGVVQPDAGRIVWNGHPVTVENPARARQLGIGMVFQHFSLFETLTVAENIALGLPADEVRDRGALEQRIREVSEHYGMALDPRRFVSTLSMGERQRVEIVRCLVQESTLLILDEPTSVLTPQEVATLFKTLRKLARDGCSILFISHKLEEVRSLCDQATVLRQGRVSGHCQPKDLSASDIARLMVGDDTPISTQVSAAQPGDTLLQVQELSWQTDDPFGTSLKNIGFSLRAGEIVGIAGVAGNGQRELAQAIAGLRTTTGGSVRLGGTDLTTSPPRQRFIAGLGYIPEDRIGVGLAPRLSVTDNAILRTYTSHRKGPFLDAGAATNHCQDLVDRFGVRTGPLDEPIAGLSGGNLQRLLVGRELSDHPQVVVAAQPTRGLDVQGVKAIQDLLIAERGAGVAVLLISEDLDELLMLADRLLVMHDGRVVAEFNPETARRHAIGEAMVGHAATGAAT